MIYAQLLVSNQHLGEPYAAIRDAYGAAWTPCRTATSRSNSGGRWS